MSISASGGESMTNGYDPVLDDVIEDVANRLQAGEPVDGAAILARYPDRADSIRRLLPAMEVMAEFGVSASRLAASGVPAGLGPIPAGRGTLGDFRIIREIGRGGMGIVYEAEQLSLGRRVALKVLPFSGAMDSQQLRRFRTEAQAAAHLHHTNIVPVFWIGSEQGVHYYAMQLIEGRTLADVIGELRHLEGKDGKSEAVAALAASALATAMSQEIPPPEGEMPPAPSLAHASGSSTRNRAYYRNVARLGLEAAEAMAHAHQEGIIHRDIKPANLMLDVKGNLWITDFGLARLQGESELTITGDLLGTLRYMSPEQAVGRRGYVDHRTDIYSLGATLYELSTLEPALGGRDRQELLRQIAVDEPRPPRRLDESIPRELETIVLKAMAKEAPGRYQAAQDLADDLRRFLEHRPIRARRPTAFEQVSKWVRRHPSIVIATVATLLATAFILAFAIVLIAREQASTREALHRARDEQENATRYAAIAQKQSERAGDRLAVVLQSLEALLSRTRDETLPDVPAVREMRHAIEEHTRRTIEQFADESSRDLPVMTDSAGVYHHLANLYFLSGRIEESTEALSRSLSLIEQLAALVPSAASCQVQLGSCHTSLGLKLYASGMRGKAIGHFDRARDAYLRAQEMDLEITDYHRRLRWFLAICPEPRFRDPDRVLALTAWMIDREKRMSKSERWDGNRTPHWVFQGIAYYQKGDFRSAIEAVERPLRSLDQRQETLYGAGDVVLGWFVLAMAYHQTGDRTSALRCYRMATRVMETKRPREAELLIARAEAGVVLGLADPSRPAVGKEQGAPARSGP